MSHACVYSVWAGNAPLSSPGSSASDQNAHPTDSFTDGVGFRGSRCETGPRRVLVSWKAVGQVQAGDNK